jgi:hypothetical protein
MTDRIRSSSAWRHVVVVAVLTGGLLVPVGAANAAKPKSSGAKQAKTHVPSATATAFSSGELQGSGVGTTGCGTNGDAEPAIHVSRQNNLFLGSEEGLGNGSDGWLQLGAQGGAGAAACSLQYAGQPNAVAGFGAAGGDIDLGWASAPNSSGAYTLYVASLNGGSVAVEWATASGAPGSFVNVPVQAGLPGDDREWIAAYGASSSLLTFHDLATLNIDVLRSDTGGLGYAQISRAIPETDYKAGNNELGNIAIDHRNAADATAGPGGLPGFWAYQSFVAPSSDPGPLASADNNEAFVAVSSDGGFTWTDRPIPCSVSKTGLDHSFPNVSVSPSGSLWASWSDDVNVFSAVSADHGQSWSCSGKISGISAQAIFPWIVATSAGEDLVYYASPTAAGAGSKQTFYVYFVQNSGAGAGAWGKPQRLFAVHQGPVCEQGIACGGDRQLLEDFGVDTDLAGWAHIAYSHDAPNLGDQINYTGYAVQTAGTRAGYPN